MANGLTINQVLNTQFKEEEEESEENGGDSQISGTEKVQKKRIKNKQANSEDDVIDELHDGDVNVLNIKTPKKIKNERKKRALKQALISEDNSHNQMSSQAPSNHQDDFKLKDTSPQLGGPLFDSWDTKRSVTICTIFCMVA
ncbi:hypothetical protein RJ639_040255 [Escallonia herrerae]|uniref:Uncharacterized protein n=1 Tax=Escallonia herrerae TaxID=1293975 RepID=A0AA89B6V4_9ASTE|nr:hypothetical protein RJ639_040255 [Escallonia herrerae]